MDTNLILGRVVLGVALATTVARADSDYATKNGQRVHRCAGAHGEIVFSGLSCGATQATGSALASSNPSAPLPAADSCPASRTELRERVVAAIARHDPNALAGMLRWRGVGGEAANSRLRTLRDLARHALLGIDADAGERTDDSEDEPARDDGGLRVRTGGGDAGGVREHAFGVSLEGGCYWLVW